MIATALLSPWDCAAQEKGHLTVRPVAPDSAAKWYVNDTDLRESSGWYADTPNPSLQHWQQGATAETQGDIDYAAALNEAIAARPLEEQQIPAKMALSSVFGSLTAGGNRVDELPKELTWTPIIRALITRQRNRKGSCSTIPVYQDLYVGLEYVVKATYAISSLPGKSAALTIVIVPGTELSVGTRCWNEHGQALRSARVIVKSTTLSADFANDRAAAFKKFVGWAAASDDAVARVRDELTDFAGQTLTPPDAIVPQSTTRDLGNGVSVKWEVVDAIP